tara:strand:- start:15 stop:347 length:333 start_codon:yes stop_codon:yes gene_type:complete
MASGVSRHGRRQTERISAPHVSLTAADGAAAMAACSEMSTLKAVMNARLQVKRRPTIGAVFAFCLKLVFGWNRPSAWLMGVNLLVILNAAIGNSNGPKRMDRRRIPGRRS